MSKRDHNTSYELEKLLSRSIDKMKENITKQHTLKREIVKLRKQRRGISPVPDEVKQWYEDTDGLDDDEENP
jgi:uncharacterized protein YydD (DUF2326 family)